MIAPTPEAVISIAGLYHAYGAKEIYRGLDLSITRGSVFGLLGKNGVGKSTLIKILMGYLVPQRGDCRVLGEQSHALGHATRERIALLFEGFVSYDGMTITQVERFFSAFYRRWQRRIFNELIAMMDVSPQQKLSQLSFGQRSQVILGLLLAQDADLLILDDYSMGLDAGYRALFIDYLKDYLAGTDKTVLMTSHVMSDLERLVDQMTIVGGVDLIHHTTMDEFCRTFRCFHVAGELTSSSELIHRSELRHSGSYLYSFASADQLEQALRQEVEEIQVGFEEKFLGYVGKY